MKYCNTCLYPETKPDIWFDENGKCSACLAFDARKDKDWNYWEAQFKQLVAKNKKHAVYDMIVPVSGGKDSHYQIIKMLELGYRPLAVNARTDDLTPIGRTNLDNIAKLGVDLIEINVNNQIRKRIAKYALETVGDISWCEHVLIFTVPFNISCQYGIPLIIYGENPQNEYGSGPRGTEQVLELGYEWLQEFGGLNGLRVDDIISAGLATKEQLYHYIMPDGYSLDVTEPKALFLGQFYNWSGEDNANLAYTYDFEFYHPGVEGTGGCNYENLDNYQTGIHDYFKYLKFGFGRATDLCCSSLRRGLIARNHAKTTIMEFDGQSYMQYLGKDKSYILEDIDMTNKEFMMCVNKFTNKELFDITGKWPKIKESILEDLMKA